MWFIDLLTSDKLGFETQGDFDEMWEPLLKRIDKLLKSKKKDAEEDKKDLIVDLMKIPGFKHDLVYNYFNECLFKTKDERVIDPDNAAAVAQFTQWLSSQSTELTKAFYTMADDPEFYLQSLPLL